MDKEAVQLSEINGALAALTNKQRQIEQNPKRNHRDFSAEGYRMQILGPGSDVERLHNELGIPRPTLRKLLVQFGFSQESVLNIVFHQEKPGFIAFQSREIDLKKPSTYISYTRDANGEMILGLEGLKEGINLRGQYKLNSLEKFLNLLLE